MDFTVVDCIPSERYFHTNIFPSKFECSLGLILLELFCSFDSAHERASTFRDCRRGLLPKMFTVDKKSPLYDIGNLILDCTKTTCSKRPTANYLASLDVFSESKIAALREQKILKLESLVERQKRELEEKDSMIARLQQELNAKKA